MPGWAGSSWYFYRYMDPTNEKEFISKNHKNTGMTLTFTLEEVSMQQDTYYIQDFIKNFFMILDI